MQKKCFKQTITSDRVAANTLILVGGIFAASCLAYNTILFSRAYREHCSAGMLSNLVCPVFGLLQVHMGGLALLVSAATLALLISGQKK